MDEALALTVVGVALVDTVVDVAEPTLVPTKEDVAVSVPFTEVVVPLVAPIGRTVVDALESVPVVVATIVPFTVWETPGTAEPEVVALPAVPTEVVGTIVGRVE